MYGTFKQHVSQQLEAIKADGLYKDERVIQSPQGASVKVANTEVLNLCANNYLGLAQHNEVKQACLDGLQRWGYGLASVRIICGTQTIH
jgi:glycine C-acetyltransferase